MVNGTPLTREKKKDSNIVITHNAMFQPAHIETI